MADGGRGTRGPGRRGDRAAESSEAEDLGPLLDLAREIKRDIDRIAADDSADVAQLSEAIDQFPLTQRRRVALAVFDRLAPDAQWAILERVFGDAEIRSYLDDEHRRRGEELARSGRRRALAEAARSTRMLDTRDLAEGDEITVGLFREQEVRAAITRGQESDTCARSIVLRCVGPGRLRVVDDVFNPRGGYFVTRDYDAATWALERFASHDVIGVGAITNDAGGRSLEPVVHLGARADFEHEGAVIRGTLHVGFVILDGIDVFAGRS